MPKVKQLPNGELQIEIGKKNIFVFKDFAHYMVFWFNYLREVGDDLIDQLQQDPMRLKLDDHDILEKPENVTRLMNDRSHVLEEPPQFKILNDLLQKQRIMRGLPTNA